MKFSHEERAVIQDIMELHKRAEILRVSSDMIYTGSEMSKIREELCVQVKEYDEKIMEMMVKLFEASSYDEIMDDYMDYQENYRWYDK